MITSWTESVIDSTRLSCQNVVNDVPVDVGQTIVAALESVRQLLVGEDRKLPYDTLAECYCVAQLRQKARTVVGQFSRHRIDLGIRGPLDRLYSSREEYTSITNAAWSRFINGTIGVEKAWPDPKRPGTLIRRYFSLPHKSISGLVQSQMIRLAF